MLVFFSLYVKERNGTNVLSVYDMKSVCVKYEESVCVFSWTGSVHESLSVYDIFEKWSVGSLALFETHTHTHTCYLKNTQLLKTQ